MSKKPLRSQAKNIVFNVYQRILDEQGAEQTQSSILSHDVQALTGVSNTTIKRIVAKGRSNRGAFSTPGKKRKGGKKINLDSFDLELIRNKINEFYTVRKKYPLSRNCYKFFGRKSISMEEENHKDLF